MYKFGRNPARHDERTFLLQKYVDLTKLPALPPRADWRSMVNAPWGMMGNDEVGDCTCAAMGHLIMLWSAAAGDIVIPSNEQVLEVYSGVTGFDPKQTQPDGSNPTDNGAVVLDVLRYMQKVGMKTNAGVKKIGPYMQLDQTSREHMKLAIELFGNAYLGIMIPQSWVGAKTWGPTLSPIAGGHAIPAVAYNTESVQGMAVISWGDSAYMLDTADIVIEEAWVILSPDWEANPPSGLDVATLKADLVALAK